MAAGAERLACGCGNADCPCGAGDTNERASGVVIHVLAESCALDAAADPHISGEAPPSRPITSEMTLAEALAPDPEPDQPTASSVKPPAALITSGGVVPAPLLAELIRGGATISPVRQPGGRGLEPHYRPSAKLAEFIRIRDLTCRFPGCDVPPNFVTSTIRCPGRWGPHIRQTLSVRVENTTC
ncbi:hypothetical protein BZL29_7158 [Mycobacterium kansasii]|uniref:DUF222 domain-containing protein n=1 Tax=Mycobacterium kansasii TaxID=1768 RepID=A0A1V3WJJ7_MYCKA|nr:hypothetical protein BZL29_7158 [Mycobacterium kansasii]